MAIRFACPECQKRFCTAARHVGKTFVCPRCQARVQVPDGPTQNLEEASRGSQVLAGILVLALLGGSAALIAQAWIGHPPSSAGQAPEPASPKGMDRSSEPPPPSTTTGAAPVEDEGEWLVQTPIQTAPPQAQAVPSPPRLAAPVLEPPVSAPPPAAGAPAGFKRRQLFSDEDLRKQLLAVPDVGLDPRSARMLLTQAALGRAMFPQRLRADLAYLPFRQDARECHLGKEPAEELQVLSRKLRSMLEAATPAGGGDVRPDPVKLRELLLTKKDAGYVSILSLALVGTPTLQNGGAAEWLRPQAVPALVQLLQAEGKPVRILLVELLERIEGAEAVAALVNRALFDLAPEVRERAIEAMRSRPAAAVRAGLLAGFRHPWPSAADHAAEALVALGDRAAAPELQSFLEEGDPRGPFERKGKTWVRELVRVNHLGNCMLCHAPSFTAADLVRGRVPLPGMPLPAPVTSPQYYGGNQGLFVRADVTYLKQDFAVMQPVPNQGMWPAHQRFDYLVRTRPARPEERLQGREEELSLQHQAALFALRELAGSDPGEIGRPSLQGLTRKDD